MKYKLNEETVAADSFNGLVEEMKKISQEWQPTSSVAEYMKTFAQRCEMQTGEKIRTDSAENFVGDLVKCGILKE